MEVRKFFGLLRYYVDRIVIEPGHAKVWVFIGDGAPRRSMVDVSREKRGGGKNNIRGSKKARVPGERGI